MPNIDISELIIVIIWGIWLWGVVDLLRSDFKNSSDKTVWMIVFLFIPVLLYLIRSVINTASATFIFAIVVIPGFIAYNKISKKQKVDKRNDV